MADRTESAWPRALALAIIVVAAFAVVAMLLPAGAADPSEPRAGWRAALVAWGFAGGAVLFVVGRMLAGRWPRRGWASAAIVLLAFAVASAVAVETSVMAWAGARFGSQASDPELIGWSTALSPLIVLVGLVATAALVLPGPLGSLARPITVASAVLALLVIASNVPGGFDGVTALGVPMAVSMAIAAGVTMAAALVAIRARTTFGTPESRFDG